LPRRSRYNIFDAQAGVGGRRQPLERCREEV
jgi:hypothetical protein